MEAFKNTVMLSLAAVTLLFVVGIASRSDETGPLPIPATEYVARQECIKEKQRLLISFGVRDTFELIRQAKSMCD
jgi:hypothetical protein